MADFTYIDDQQAEPSKPSGGFSYLDEPTTQSPYAGLYPELPQTAPTSWYGALGRGVGRQAAPLAGGAAAGTAASLALAPETAGLSLIAIPLIASLAGYAGTKYGQDKVADAYLKGTPLDALTTDSEQKDMQEHQYMSLAANVLPMVTEFSPTGVIKAGKSILTGEGRQALQRGLTALRSGAEVKGVNGLLNTNEDVQALNHVMHVLGMSGFGAVQGALEGQTPSDIALNAGMMSLFNKGWARHKTMPEAVEAVKKSLAEESADAMKQNWKTGAPLADRSLIPPSTENEPASQSELETANQSPQAAKGLADNLRQQEREGNAKKAFDELARIQQADAAFSRKVQAAAPVLEEGLSNPDTQSAAAAAVEAVAGKAVPEAHQDQAGEVQKVVSDHPVN